MGGAGTSGAPAGLPDRELYRNHCRGFASRHATAAEDAGFSLDHGDLERPGPDGAVTGGGTRQWLIAASLVADVLLGLVFAQSSWPTPGPGRYEDSSAIAAVRPVPVPWSGHYRTERGWGHRAMRSRATWRHASEPVPGIGMPKLWAYTSSRGTVLASTS